ncbi:MAG: AAA family ATPase [Deltaproteobacteria bacterium]|nr:AAA family ATPase [Deltaproteobacteria bacterium]
MSTLFFLSIKSSNNFTRFAFVTGETHYAMTDIADVFSHMTDITLDPKYSSICGFTAEEPGFLFRRHVSWNS